MRRARPATLAYLGVVGSRSVWHLYLAVLCGAWCIYCQAAGSRTFLPYGYLTLAPIFVGTGILTAARAGVFDLLFGAGLARVRVYWTACLFSIGSAAFATTAVFVAALELKSLATLVRLVCVLLFTCGVSFSLGIRETRYLAGVSWILVRFLFVISPGGLDTLRLINVGPGLPPSRVLVVTTILVPEMGTDPRMPIGYVLAGALVGLGVLWFSSRVFVIADFPGKRS
jgi:hypothetical protein